MAINEKWFQISSKFLVTKNDVFDYWEANEIEYDPDTAKPTEADFQAAAETLAADGVLEIEVSPVY